MMLRMRVQSPNTNFKIILKDTSGSILTDAPSVVGYGASISQLIFKDELPADKKVLIKFQFFDFLKTPQEVIEHDDIHNCHLPHILLEMSIMSIVDFVERKIKYLDDLPSDIESKFPDIDDTVIGYHDATFGNSEDEETSLKLSDEDNYYSLNMTDSEHGGKFEILKEYHISISSEAEREKNKDAMPLLYYLQLQITADFMTSGSMHVVVVHEDDGSDALEQKSNLFAYETLNCAEDLVWVVSQRTAKNEERLNIALTEGEYAIYFIDYQNQDMRLFIAEHVRKIAFSSVINLYPIESESNSIYCDGLAVPNPYFIPYVISEDYKFDQRIEINFRNETQELYFDIDIGQSQAMLLRVTTEDDIGIDIDIRVFDDMKNI